MLANPPVIPDVDFARLRLRLSQLRAERGLTYHDLAAQAGTSRSMLVALESGTPRAGSERRVQGSLAAWHRTADALGVRLSDLLTALDSHRIGGKRAPG